MTLHLQAQAQVETRIATALARGTAPDAAAELAHAIDQKLGGTGPALLTVFSSTSQPLPEILPLLQARFPGTVVLGASTAGEFTEQGDTKGAVAAFAVRGDSIVHAGMGEGLRRNASEAVATAVRDLPRSIEGYPFCTALLLLDPLAGNGEQVTLMTALLLGRDVPLAGGAAGDDLRMKATHVGLAGRVATDAVVVALLFSRRPLGLGVCHGHQPLSRPLRVTSASRNVVTEIEEQPAWQVWQAETRESALRRGLDPARLQPEEIGGYLLQYEAGLPTGSDYRIRAPLSVNANGSLNFACGIPEGAEIRITESTPERQVESAREAARRARRTLAGARCAGALVFDCICRQLILGPDFSRAVRAISAELDGQPIAGFETYAEIAYHAGDLSGFHNTTTVVLAFPS